MVNREFVTAGKATFTVDNGRGDWETFRVTRSKDGKVYFVTAMSGPDNENSYSYLGILNVESGEVRLTKASRYEADHRYVRIVRWALGIVWNGGTLPDGYAIKHAGRCCRCGRQLTTPESLASGIGPECAGRMAAEKVRETVVA